MEHTKYTFNKCFPEMFSVIPGSLRYAEEDQQVCFSEGMNFCHGWFGTVWANKHHKLKP